MLGWTVWFHRWSGILLCLFFAMWFATGAVMVFVPFPALSASERARASATVDVSQIVVTAPRALDLAGGGTALRIVDVGGRAAYVVDKADGRSVAVDAASGAVLDLLSASQAARIAAQFAGGEPALVAAGPLEYDQWIVPNGYDAARPYYRVPLQDDAGTILYVSARTGEVRQKTTSGARAWNWAGSVLHWIYLTPLRKSHSNWDLTVWWLSLVALTGSVGGMFLGVYRGVLHWRRSGTRGERRVSPYRGWMRWHHLLGLAGGTALVCWILSGWLSMDHGRLFSRGQASDAAASRYAGLTMPEAARAVTPEALKRVGPASSIEVRAIAGEAYLHAVGGLEIGSRVLLLSEEGAGPAQRLPQDLLDRAVGLAFPDSAAGPPGTVPATDVYAVSEGMPDGVLRYRLGSGDVDVHVDPGTGDLVAAMDPSRRAYSWVYYSLHTLKFPGLIERPNLRRALALTLLGLGFALAVTGVVIGVQRLRKDLSRSR
jgi:uncharacterized iron-regulated membrane protein